MQIAAFLRFHRVLFAAGLALLPATSCARSGLLLPEELHGCLALEPNVAANLTVSAEVLLDRSDILFLVDNSNSMAHEIERIRTQLVDVLVPQIAERVDDAQLGVAVFSDFGERDVGERSHPYQLLQPITSDIGRVLEAAQNIELEFGGDRAESQLEALYQVATGEGLGVFVDEGPQCPDGGRAGACFRPGAFAITMLFTDAPMRNVTGIGLDGLESPPLPGLVEEDAPFIPYLRGYDETLEKLQSQSIRVVGLWSGVGDGADDLRRVARDTGTLDQTGLPIVLDIGTRGEGLGEGVIQSLELATEGARLELQLELDDADLGDGVDSRTFVVEVRALRAEPADGAVLNGQMFSQVRSGTRVFFDVVLDPARVPQAVLEQPYPLGLRVVASDGTLLSDEIVDVVISHDACGQAEAAFGAR